MKTRNPLRSLPVGRVLTYALLVLAALYSVWPILIMALEGYGIDLAALFTGQPFACRLVGNVQTCGGFFPTSVYYEDALKLVAFPRLLENTTIIAAISIAIALSAGVLAGYTLARIPVRGKDAISYMLLALRAVSPFAVLVPLYVAFTRYGLWDSYVGVALTEELVVLSVVVWMLRGFFSDIPKSIYDAAAVFGASEWQTLRRVALRMVVPGILVTALFAYVLIWNDFLISDVMTGPVTKSVMVGVWSGLGENSGIRQVSFDALNAAGFLAWLPAVAVLLAIRRYLAKGYSLGAASSI
jgi:multiple sugar transport system permease protein